MRTFALFFVIFLSVTAVNAQEVQGTWAGDLNFAGTTMKVVFHLDKEENGYTATMDSPMQNAFDIPVDSVVVEGEEIDLFLQGIRAHYKASINSDGNISGTFSQSGMELPLVLTKLEKGEAVLYRPQEPKAPFPYELEEVIFENTEQDVRLAGTLTLPKGEGPFKAIVLISGSGPQDRNETLMGHKPFLLIADHLTRKGLAVLRYDDRGVGKSTGVYQFATTHDFANDTEAGFKFLKNDDRIDKSSIGLLGHSEGALIASMVAARNTEIAFVAMLGGPGVKGSELLAKQRQQIMEVSGVEKQLIDLDLEMMGPVFEMIDEEKNNSKLAKRMHAYFEKVSEDPHFSSALKEMSKTNFVNANVSGFSSPWMAEFLRIDPAEYQTKMHCPVLVLSGAKDLQVNAEMNNAKMRSSFKVAKNNDVEFVVLDGLNHLFQECTTGVPNEYAEIEQTMSPKALDALSIWLLEL